MKRKALISVSDKGGLAGLMKCLPPDGWTILSTGGTARFLRELGIEVEEISSYTGFPEILGGRVKTLHPGIFAGILAAPSEEHRREIGELGLAEIDLVVVNLYPFRQTVAREGVSLSEAVEQIDIGGPSLLRAAAKNFQRVAVVVDPTDYSRVEEALAEGEFAMELRRKFALKVFRHTASYDAAISAHLPSLVEGGGKSFSAAAAEALMECEETPLRYGENPHQWGLLARSLPLRGLAGARQIQGKALSYNNLGDGTGAWRLVWDLPGAGVAVIKHANPCGVAVGENMAETFRRARATDPISAFGGVIAANRGVDADFAEAVVENFAELVIAPSYSEAALKVFARKKNLRVLEAERAEEGGFIVRDTDGGFLLQQRDAGFEEDLKTVSRRAVSEAEKSALELAWRVVKHAGSNAIVVGGKGQILGIGAGQMSRVDAAKIAVSKALEIGHDLKGAVAASDAFFPFPDGVEALAEAGIRAVIQPGGSIRDASVIEACDRLGLSMVFTGRRHFRH